MEDRTRRPNAFQLLLDIVDRPARALSEVASHPGWRWVLPALIVLAAAVASVVLLRSLAEQQPLSLLRLQLQTVPVERIAPVESLLAQINEPWVALGLSIGARIVALILGWLIALLILYLAIIIGGGETQPSRVLAALPWLWVPFALRDMVQTVYVLYRGSPMANTGLSYLVSTGHTAEDLANVWYHVLKQVDLFALWHLVLIYVLFRVVPSFGRAKAFVLAVVYAAVSIGVRLLPMLLPGGLLR